MQGSLEILGKQTEITFLRVQACSDSIKSAFREAKHLDLPSPFVSKLVCRHD